MKLYIKQKVFSFKDRFTVYDEWGKDKYYVEGELFSFGKKLHVYDLNGTEIAYIEQKILSFLPRFFVFMNGLQVAEIVKQFSFFKPRYTIEGLGWEIDGNFWQHDYVITKSGRPIVTIMKEWMTWGDCYELDITDYNDEQIALAVVLTIDCVLANQQAAAAST